MEKWYNIVLLVALLLTFSLAAYVIYVVVIFLKLWVQRKQFIGKLIMMVAFISTMSWVLSFIIMERIYSTTSS